MSTRVSGGVFLTLAFLLASAPHAGSQEVDESKERALRDRALNAGQQPYVKPQRERRERSNVEREEDRRAKPREERQKSKRKTPPSPESQRRTSPIPGLQGIH
jgi:hypothetical protein